MMHSIWAEVRDGNDVARGLMRRHYTWREYADHRPRRKFVGPGEYIALMTPDGLALFVWRRFIEMGQTEPKGINCSVFRNEGPVLSSVLIREAMDIAWRRWPGERLYTYVNPARIKSTNPGYCFLKAGWTRVPERTMRGLIVLECRMVTLAPGHQPAPAERQRPKMEAVTK